MRECRKCGKQFKNPYLKGTTVIPEDYDTSLCPECNRKIDKINYEETVKIIFAEKKHKLRIAVRMSRYEPTISLDKIAEILKDELGDEAKIVADRINK